MVGRLTHLKLVNSYSVHIHYGTSQQQKCATQERQIATTNYSKQRKSFSKNIVASLSLHSTYVAYKVHICGIQRPVFVI